MQSRLALIHKIALTNEKESTFRIKISQILITPLPVKESRLYLLIAAFIFRLLLSLLCSTFLGLHSCWVDHLMSYMASSQTFWFVSGLLPSWSFTHTSESSFYTCERCYLTGFCRSVARLLLLYCPLIKRPFLSLQNLCSFVVFLVTMSNDVLKRSSPVYPAHNSHESSSLSSKLPSKSIITVFYT